MPTPGNVSEAIAGRLLGDAGVTALVSTRITPDKPMQEPDGNYLSFWRVSGGDGYNLARRNGLQQYQHRVEATARTQAEAEAILQAALLRLCGDNDAVDPWVDKANGIFGCFAVGDADEQTLDDGRQVSGQSFNVWFKPR